MKRFYITRAPGTNKDNNAFLKATIAEALAEASKRMDQEPGPLYVVQVIRKIERSTPPVKVTVVR